MPLDPKYNSVTTTKKKIFAGKTIVGHQATCYPREAGGGGGVYFPIMVYTGRLPRKGLGISLAEV